MKIPQLFRYKKFRAATARRPSAAAGMDFEDIPEPNMKLSRALLIVLLLHVVAVSGIIAFNAIKTRESSFVPAAPAQAENNAADTTGTPVHAEVAKARPAVWASKWRRMTMRKFHIRRRRTNMRKRLRLLEKLTL